MIEEKKRWSMCWSLLYGNEKNVYGAELLDLRNDFVFKAFFADVNDLEKWLLFMKSDKKTKEALAVGSSTLKEALTQIERLSQDPETRRMAISREIQLKDQLQREEDAEFRGIEKGIEKGKVVGREEGAHLRDRVIVLNMYAEDLPAESIAQLTKIPLGEVKGIIESIVQ